MSAIFLAATWVTLYTPVVACPTLEDVNDWQTNTKCEVLMPGMSYSAVGCFGEAYDPVATMIWIMKDGERRTLYLPHPVFDARQHCFNG